MANGRFDLGEWNCITTWCFLFLFCGQQDSSRYWFGWGPDLSLSEKMAPEFFIKVGTQAITAKPPKQPLWIFLQGKNNHEACINSLSSGFISSHPLITFVSDLQRNCIFQKFFSPWFLSIPSEIYPQTDVLVGWIQVGSPSFFTLYSVTVGKKVGNSLW